ncbi:hypothetical protein [Methanoculleus chikugoensis]|uniref:hypothetical protein n=1 Tax=Methanoculleus chikugoensis TaxID=118126 RepID=UPI000A9AA536|nr:hypothetical protein [Methanoculleus chikugoensis]
MREPDYPSPNIFFEELNSGLPPQWHHAAFHPPCVCGIRGGFRLIGRPGRPDEEAEQEDAGRCGRRTGRPPRCGYRRAARPVFSNGRYTARRERRPAEFIYTLSV